MRYRLIIAVALLALGLGAYVYMHKARPDDQATLIHLYSTESYWIPGIISEGGVQAYAAFKNKIANIDLNKRHAMAHAFGSALFKVEGINAFSVCDTSINYGCAHQFTGAAVQALGLSVIQDLNTSCLSRYHTLATGCQHGIGHGIVAYVGYRQDGLAEAVSLCDKYATSSSAQGCIGGVFMEYNERTMMGADSVPRPGSTDIELTALCGSFTGIAAQSCNFYLPQWWWDVLPHADIEQAFDHMHSLCGSLKTSAGSRSCYEGLGAAIPRMSQFNPVVARTLCDRSPDKQKALMCRAYAANIFLPVDPVEAKQLCEGLTGAAGLYCVTYATTLGGINHELPLP